MKSGRERPGFEAKTAVLPPPCIITDKGLLIRVKVQVRARGTAELNKVNHIQKHEYTFFNYSQATGEDLPAIII